MATSVEFIEFVHQQSGLGDGMNYKKMFGEYALYIDGKVIALVCDNSLYLKPSKASENLLASFSSEPPYPGAKPYLVIDELLDDSERLQELLLATASALPAVKPKAKKTGKKTAKMTDKKPRKKQ